MKRFGWWITLFVQAVAVAQPSVQVKVLPLYGQQALIPERLYADSSGSIQIDQLRFYVSRVQLLHRGKVVYSDRQAAHLLDVEGALTFSLPLKKQVMFDSVRVLLGIDSAMNTSGAWGGDLDPTRGMYWTWQSGYIDIKMEGLCRGCNSNKSEFQLHLGGYRGAESVSVPMQFPAATDTIKLALHLDRFFAAQPLLEGTEVLSPGARAVALAKLFAVCIEPLKP